MKSDKPSPETSPRDRIVYTAVQHLREHGVEGTGLRPLVADAGAPWGSLRHYFPGGKDQIIVEALEWAGAFAAETVERYFRDARTPSGQGLLATVIGWWIDDLQLRDFARGCPVAAAVADAADGGEGSAAICAAAAAAFDVWLTPIRNGLVALGHRPHAARELATLLLAALEGAVLMARAQRSVQPLRVVERRLRPLFEVA